MPPAPDAVAPVAPPEPVAGAPAAPPAAAATLPAGEDLRPPSPAAAAVPPATEAATPRADPAATAPAQTAAVVPEPTPVPAPATPPVPAPATPPPLDSRALTARAIDKELRGDHWGAIADLREALVSETDAEQRQGIQNLLKLLDPPR